MIERKNVFLPSAMKFLQYAKQTLAMRLETPDGLFCCSIPVRQLLRINSLSKLRYEYCRNGQGTAFFTIIFGE